MTVFNKRKFFYFLGASVVLFWLVMVGLLIRKTQFQGNDQLPGIPAHAGNMDRSQHEWMEIYLKGKKVGFSEMRLSPLGQELLIEEKMELALNLMGQPSVMRMSTRAVLDKGYALKRFLMIIDSGVVRFRVSGKVDGDRILVETGEGEKARKHTISVDGPLTIGAGITGFFNGRKIKVGETFRFTMFDPSVLSHRDVAVKVADKTVISLSGKEYSAFRLETKAWGQSLVFWLNEDGVLLKEEGFMGLTLVRSDKAHAPFDVDGSAGADLYDAAAVSVKRTLDRARDITYLKLNVAGLRDTGFDLTVLNENRQKLKGNVLEITQEIIPRRVAWKKGSITETTPDLKAFLSPEINIQSDDGALLKKVREIAGDEEDKRSVAQKLMAWVYENVEKRPVVSVPDALTVLETKVGDCNEHAVLLTALLRAAGIPARECVGIVYSDNRFFYHAWTEAWLGRWISMDATLNQMPVDATHIKLVHGGLDRQAGLMALMGKLKLEIVDYKHD
ncbi:MAG: transglutaminase-like domain-containing protein [Deltaproteobacteria bacterium]|nr:transglutaminase-like domain-containing protein [Deltaproteobacteria bacterium]